MTLIDVLIIVLSIGTFFSGIDPAWIALIGTLFGGVGLKVAEHYLGKRQMKAAEQQAFSRDYRAEIKELTDRLDYEEKREEEWREKYYASQEELSKLRQQLGEAVARNKMNMIE